MKSVLTTCIPRPDLVAGTFNPEVFTASLSQVIAHYRGKRSQLASVYTDPKQFFGEATFPTDEGAALSEADITRATLELRQKAESEFAPALAITRLETSNQTAADAQRMLVALIARHLLGEVDRVSPNILSREAIKQIAEALATSTDTEMVVDGPRELLGRLKDYSLFTIEVPRMGDTGRIHACRVLLTCAVEHAQRVVEHIGKPKVQQLRDLLRRLDKDIADAGRRLGSR